MTMINSRKTLQLAKASLEADAAEFIRLTEEVTRLMANEKDKTDRMQVEGKLATIKPVGDAVIIGDLHGDLESLVHILSTSGFLGEGGRKENVMFLFLGDYGDRGSNSAEVYYVVMRLKQEFPERVVLMRGNHEGPEDLLAHPHDLPVQFQKRFGDDGQAAYLGVRELFDELYTVALVKERFVMIHGGFPSHARSVNDLAFAHRTHPKTDILEEMLWNDPEETVSGTLDSPRGAGKLFGGDVTLDFLKMLNVNALIRGHEPCSEGFKLNHDGKVLTLFSRKGEPYFNEHGAYLRVNLSFKPTNAEQLLPWIRKF